MRQITRTVPAPADLGLDVIGVPLAAPLELDLRLEAVVDGVLVSGSVRAPLAGECVRCLEPLTSEVDVTFQELYVYPDEGSHGHGSTRPGAAGAGETDDEDGVSRLEGDLLDLEPVVRDAVVLALPFQPVCRDDCPGLCPDCGARLADDPDHSHESIDPRWAALHDLLDQNHPHQQQDQHAPFADQEES
jgi:uncharacterized protein